MQQIARFFHLFKLHYIYLTPGKIMHREMTHILVDHGSKIEEPEVDGVKPTSIEPALSKIQEVCE